MALGTGLDEDRPLIERLVLGGGAILRQWLREPLGIAVPAVVLGIFLIAPQMPDMFAGVEYGSTSADGRLGRALWHPLGFGISAAILGLFGWYWTRASLLARKDRVDAGGLAPEEPERPLTTEEKERKERNVWAREWAPRCAIIFAGLILGVPIINTVFERSPHLPSLGMYLNIVFVVAAFYFVSKRRQWGLTSSVSAPDWMKRTRVTSVIRSAPFGWPVAGALLLLSVGGMIVVGAFPRWIDEHLDSVTAGLLALSLCIGPVVIVLALLRDVIHQTIVSTLKWLNGRRGKRGQPEITYRFKLAKWANVMGLITLVCLLYITPHSEPAQLYRVRLLTTDATQAVAEALVTERPTIEQALAQWAGAVRAKTHLPDDKPLPVIIVTAEGGASRAAAWMLSAMRMLDARTRGAFGTHVFAISGVSGGSLGAVTYLQAAQAYPGTRGGVDWDNAHVTEGLRELARADLMPATLSTYFLNDVFGRLLGFAWPAQDRGAALEGAFETHWENAFEFAHAQEGLLALRVSAENRAALPHLLLNGTDAGSGRRLITSTFQFDSELFSASDDLLKLVKSDVKLATAVTNSARFPFVSPAGRFQSQIEDSKGNVREGAVRQIVDGGYFENYGVRTASELAARIRTIDPSEKTYLPIVVVISNDVDGYAEDFVAIDRGGLTIEETTVSCTTPEPTKASKERAAERAKSNSVIAPSAMVSPALDVKTEPDAKQIVNEGRKAPIEPVQETARIRTEDAQGAAAEALAPLLGLLATRGAHGLDALYLLRRQQCDVVPVPPPVQDQTTPAAKPEPQDLFVHIGLPIPNGQGEAAPMNWVLNPDACHYLLNVGPRARFNDAQSGALARLLGSINPVMRGENYPRPIDCKAPRKVPCDCAPEVEPAQEDD